MDDEQLTRASFGKLSPVPSPVPIPAPDRVWSAAEWALIRRGHRSRDMDDRWHAFTEGSRLFLHRSWTGRGVYEAEFTDDDVAWRITQAVVTGDSASYRRGPDEYESLLLVWIIDGVLLDRWDNVLWNEAQRLRS